MARIACAVCKGSGEDPENPYQSCKDCAGQGNHPEHTKASFSPKYGGRCVDLMSMEADPDEVICWAYEIDAAFETRGRDLVVVRYKGDSKDDALYRIPHPYSPSELRNIFRFHRQRSS